LYSTSTSLVIWIASSLTFKDELLAFKPDRLSIVDAVGLRFIFDLGIRSQKLDSYISKAIIYSLCSS
jgi:hypothetical protein